MSAVPRHSQGIGTRVLCIIFVICGISLNAAIVQPAPISDGLAEEADRKCLDLTQELSLTLLR